MDIADIKPLLSHADTGMEAPGWQAGVDLPLLFRHHLPEITVLHEEKRTVSVGVIGGVQVAHRVVTGHQRWKDIHNLLGKAIHLLIKINAEGSHLRMQG